MGDGSPVFGLNVVKDQVTLRQFSYDLAWTTGRILGLGAT